VITIGSIRFRLSAAALAVAGFGFGAAQLLTTDFERPNFSDVAEFVREAPRGVLVDAAAISPGPRTNFEVDGSRPEVEVLRLNAPEQQSQPFSVVDRLAVPSELARRAVREADGAPITVLTASTNAVSLINPFAGKTIAPARTAQFIAELPPSYELAERRLFPGFVDLEALVFERRRPEGDQVRGGDPS
jgi:hypothetical protein